MDDLDGGGSAELPAKPIGSTKHLGSVPKTDLLRLGPYWANFTRGFYPAGLG